jgi:outer membrane murein-binding lipoprotein Lpp
MQYLFKGTIMLAGRVSYLILNRLSDQVEQLPSRVDVGEF